MRKVSLREIVADKIVFAILIALYYWMWARNDWHNYYTSIQYAVFAFTFFYFISRASRLKKYKQELPDEMSEANLKRCDALCLKRENRILTGTHVLRSKNNKQPVLHMIHCIGRDG